MLKRRSIKPGDFEMVLTSDIEVYPTEAPLTVETLSKWYTHHPEFGMVYYYDESEKGLEGSEKIVATCCVVPLTTEGWLQLTRGAIIESQLEDEMLFDISQLPNDEIGLHIYHMERYPSWASLPQTTNKERFGTLVLKSIQEILEKLRTTNKNLSVIGLSGLCVSTSGINLFSNLYNCREREPYICREHILRVPKVLQTTTESCPFRTNRTGLIVLESDNQAELTALLDQGYRYITRCKMLVLKPDDFSIVWHYIQLKS